MNNPVKSIRADYSYMLDEYEEELKAKVISFKKLQKMYADIEAKLKSYTFYSLNDLIENHSSEEMDEYFRLEDELRDLESDLMMLHDDLENDKDALKFLGIEY